MKKYEAPRAVRLSDANTASLQCIAGPTGTNDLCQSGLTPSEIRRCNPGSNVSF